MSQNAGFLVESFSWHCFLVGASIWTCSMGSVGSVCQLSGVARPSQLSVFQPLRLPCGGFENGHPDMISSWLGDWKGCPLPQKIRQHETSWNPGQWVTHFIHFIGSCLNRFDNLVKSRSSLQAVPGALELVSGARITLRPLLRSVFEKYIIKQINTNEIHSYIYIVFNVRCFLFQNL